MADFASKDYAFQDPPFKDGDVIEGGNFTQLLPATEICKDVKTLTINGGNFVNCIPQPGWTINGGNWAQKGFCSHKLPGFVRHGLPECGDDCEHQSAEKESERVTEEEYRNLKREAEDIQSPVEDKDLSVVKPVDADGVTLQEFRISRYGYTDTTVSGGGKIKKMAGVK
jgi:hypothetical protein